MAVRAAARCNFWTETTVIVLSMICIHFIHFTELKVSRSRIYVFCVVLFGEGECFVLFFFVVVVFVCFFVLFFISKFCL